MSIEDISEDIMGIPIPQMSKRKKKMLDVATNYLDLLDDLNGAKATPEILKLKDDLDALSIPFENNLAYSAFLKRKRLLVEKKKGL